MALTQAPVAFAPGAFRMFQDTIERAGLREEWFAFKHQALRKIAQEALEDLGIPCK